MKWMILCSLIIMTSCTKEDKKEKSTVLSVEEWDASKITAGTNLTEYSSLEAEEALNSNIDSFLANVSSEGTETADEEGTTACIQDAFNNIVMEADDNSVSFGTKLDLSNCIKEAYAEEGLTVNSLQFILNISVEMTCSTGGLGDYNGLTSKDLPAKNPCESGNSGLKTYINFLTSGNLSYEGASLEFADDSVSAFGKADGSVCDAELKDGVWELADGCLSVYRAVNIKSKMNDIDSPSSGLEDYFKAESVGIKALNDDTSTWYKEGSFKTTVGAWQGSVDYSNATTAPTFLLTLGDDIASGSLSPATSLKAFLKHSITNQSSQMIQPLRALKITSNP